jgi:hypothetical protein
MLGILEMRFANVFSNRHVGKPLTKMTDAEKDKAMKDLGIDPRNPSWPAPKTNAQKQAASPGGKGKRRATRLARGAAVAKRVEVAQGRGRRRMMDCESESKDEEDSVG